MTSYTPAQWQEAIAALGSAGGGASSVADGANVAEGTTTDAAVTNPASAATQTAILKGLLTNTADLLADGDFLTTISTNTGNTTTQATNLNTAVGAVADAVVTSSASSGSAIAFLKNLATIAGAITSSVMQSNTKQVNGTTIDVNQGTIGAGTQRVTPGGAATGTKSSVASSASSVTILASNTSRKGATAYNDSTQICYLDCSGGTASATSYTLQVPANGFFELPGPNIYNGAITGIWAAANGNMRVTEWT